MRRGDIFRLRLGRRHGHERSGVRYGVIVRSDALTRLSTVLIAPTSTAARPAASNPQRFQAFLQGSVPHVTAGTRPRPIVRHQRLLGRCQLRGVHVSYPHAPIIAPARPRARRLRSR